MGVKIERRKASTRGIKSVEPSLPSPDQNMLAVAGNGLHIVTNKLVICQLR
jgi:hypothetical protein